MVALSYSQILSELSLDYYNREISIDEYRLRRRKTLNSLDCEHNGAECFDTIPKLKMEEHASSSDDTTAFLSIDDTTIEVKNNRQ